MGKVTETIIEEMAPKTTNEEVVVNVSIPDDVTKVVVNVVKDKPADEAGKQDESTDGKGQLLNG